MLVKSLILIQSDKHTHSGKQNIQVTLCRMLLYQKNLLVILLAASRLLQRLTVCIIMQTSLKILCNCLLSGKKF